MAMYPCLSLPSLSFPSVSGAVCSFDSQYAGIPLKAHTVDINAVQSGSGTPSPDNVRPISGWSAITITANSVPTVISIGSTIYGGNYDAVSGVLTTEWIMLNMGSIDWVENGTYPNVFNTYPLAQTIYNTSSIVADIYEVYTSGTVMNYDYGIAVSAGLDRIYVKNKDYSTAASFKTAMNGKYLAYKLATPQTIQLPPVRVETQGVNNVFADTGDTTLQYIKIGR
jgi:hypothetical protein